LEIFFGIPFVAAKWIFAKPMVKDGLFDESYLFLAVYLNSLVGFEKPVGKKGSLVNAVDCLQNFPFVCDFPIHQFSLEETLALGTAGINKLFRYPMKRQDCKTTNPEKKGKNKKAGYGDKTIEKKAGQEIS
jgi:hypothetical protein